MSSAEVVAVLEGMGTILRTTSSIGEIYATVKDLHGLPIAFSIVSSRLSLVQNILDSAKRQVGAEEDEDLCKMIKPTVDKCEANIKKIEGIFEIVKPGDDAWNVERYYKAVRANGKGSKIETLMVDVFKDVKLLSSRRIINSATEDQRLEILAAIQQLTDISPSVPDNKFYEPAFAMNQSGSGNTQQYTASGNFYSSMGGNQFNGHNQTFNKEY